MRLAQEAAAEAAASSATETAAAGAAMASKPHVDAVKAVKLSPQKASGTGFTSGSLPPPKIAAPAPAAATAAFAAPATKEKSPAVAEANAAGQRMDPHSARGSRE